MAYKRASLLKQADQRQINDSECGCAAGYTGRMIKISLLVLAIALGQPPASAPTAPAAPAKATNPATTPAPRNDNPGWVQRNDAFNARAKQGAAEGDIGIVFLGDSITEGWEGHGKEVWAKSYAARHAVNLGIGGDRTQHVLWRIQNGNLDGLAKPAKGSAPKLAVIMIGTNNTGSDSAEQIAAGIGEVVKSTREKLPEAKVLLLAVFPRGKDATDPARAKIAEINQRAAAIADGKAVFFQDIGDKFLAPDGTLPDDIMPDHLHLSAKGYQIWADAIDPKVSELLGESKPKPPAPPPK